MLRAASAAWLLATALGADADEDWLQFPSPSGAILVHKDCVHRVDDRFHVDAGHEGGDLLSYGSKVEAVPPCPHAPRRLTRAAAEEAGVASGGPEYYSDWAAYAQTTHSDGIGYMASDWQVPAAPKSTGPVPGLSSAYLFNGLENSGGHTGTASFILQPVLSYGKSGCVVDPLNFFQWHLISFLVTDAGRAYCGQRLSVQEGEALRGVMRLGEDGHTWTVESTRLSNNQTSTYSIHMNDAKADAAYLTLETMVNYNCKAFPSSGSVTFTRNILEDPSGGSVKPEWVKKLLHTECHQRVSFGTDGTVTIAWDVSHTAEDQLPLVV